MRRGSAVFALPAEANVQPRHWCVLLWPSHNLVQMCFHITNVPNADRHLSDSKRYLLLTLQNSKIRYFVHFHRTKVHHTHTHTWMITISTFKLVQKWRWTKTLKLSYENHIMSKPNWKNHSFTSPGNDTYKNWLSHLALVEHIQVMYSLTAWASIHKLFGPNCIFFQKYFTFREKNLRLRLHWLSASIFYSISYT